MPRVRAPRRQRLRTTALLALVAGATAATALPATAAAPAPAGPLRFSTTTLHFATTVGPADHRVSCDVVGDLRVPETVDAAHPAPAMLMTNGFGGGRGSTGPNGNASYGARFAEQGYVTLSYSGLGFGGSGCNIYIDDPVYDGQAASQLVGFLGGATGVATGPDGAPFDVAGLVRRDAVAHDGVAHDHDPRVGMIGGSYGGQIQFAVAGIDPRVDVLAPTYTWNDLDYSLSPNNTALTSGVQASTPGVAKYQWDTLFFGLGVAQPVLHPVYPTDPSLCVSTRAEVCQADAEQDSQGFPSPATQAFYSSVSVASYMDKIRIPVLLSQGQNDSLFDLQEAIATYDALRKQGNPVRMVWQSWGHSGGTPVPGELDPGDATYGTGHFQQSVQGRIWTDWFAHWLKDQNTDLGPAVRYFRDYAYQTPGDPNDVAGAYAAASAAYASAKSYPVGAPSRLRLSGGSSLVSGTTPVVPGSSTFANAGAGDSSYSETSAVGALVAPYDAPGTFGAWTSAPLAQAADVAGVPALDVKVSSAATAATQAAGPAGQLTLFAKLYDVAPDGSTTLVHNLVSPLRVPDVGARLHVELPGVVHRYAAGHRLQLVLATGDSAYRGSSVPTTVTVVDDPLAPNVLTLPLVSAGGVTLSAS